MGVAGIAAGLGLAALLLAGPAGAQEEAGEIGCEVAGYDVIIRNQGAGPIAAGTTVSWSVPFARKQGSHDLAAALEPGGSLFLSGVMGSTYLAGGKPCSATIG